MFELYYLADQADEIKGAKCFQTAFFTEEECHDKAKGDGVVHYSVEYETATEATIIYVQ